MFPISRHESPPRPISRPSYPVVLIAIVLGCGLSVLAFWATLRWEMEQGARAFATATTTISNSVESCLLHQIDSVRVVAGVYQAFPEQIGRKEYRNFVEPLIARCDALLGVYSVPRVTAAERDAFEAQVSRESTHYSIVEYDDQGRLVRAGARDEYFPVLYEEPFGLDWYPRGLDLASLADARETVELVRRTGDTRFVPYQAADNKLLEVLFHPVYRTQAGTSSATPPTQEFAGLVIALSSFSRILEEGFERAGNPALRLEVQEVLQDGVRRPVYSHPPASATQAPSALYLLSASIAPRETELTADNYVLALRFIPGPAMYRQRAGWLPFGVMFAGLLFTSLTATWLYRERRNTARVAALAQRLAAEDTRKNEFLAVLGHELRNPLAPIANAVHILRAERPPSPTRLQWAEGVIERQVIQLVRLVDDLLDVARITRGTISLRSDQVDLKEVVQRAVETVQPLIDARHHRLREHLPSAPVPVRGDHARLVQVLVNLLDNAAKYTPEGGDIEIGLKREDEKAVLSVRDNGVGISEQDLPGVFALFGRLPHRDRHAGEGGLGVGLALARHLVEMHGGKLDANSAGPGAGSEFTVRLPISSGARQVMQSSPATGASPRRVLVVEDNEEAASSFKALLEVMGHEVMVASDGPAGLAAARSFAPDIAFLDIGLPGMDGYELARRLRREPVVPYLVALTGYGQAGDREQSRVAGFDRHLVKPAQLDVLRELLHRVPARGTRDEDRQAERAEPSARGTQASP